MRATLALALAFALALVLPLVPAGHATDPAPPTAAPITLVDEHGVARSGFAAAPASPVGIVLIAHGYGHPASDHVGHLEHLAAQGYLAIAMDYGGDIRGFPLRSGADATNAALREAVASWPGLPVTLYSVSMGTTVAGMVLAENPGVIAYWVDTEGLSMLAETWAEATALAPANAFAKTASDAITLECGGTPATQPLCYHERSAALRARAFVGLRGVIALHGLNDGLVPYDQGREMAAALRATGVPVDFWTVIRGHAGDEGTTITGYGGANVDGLAGHGTESVDSDTLTALSFRVLDDLLAGREVPADRELVTDREFGTLP